MNNSIKFRNSKEVAIQLKRAEVQKNILIKNIYREYETYYQIVRKSLLTSTEKGIFSLYSNLSLSDKELDSKELINFLNKNISFLIHSKLPLVTIEQLKIGGIIDPHKKLVNVNALKELVEFKEYQAVNVDYESELISKEPLEFHCDNNSNTYKYYNSINEGDLASVNLDETDYLDSFSKQNSIKIIEYEKNIDESVLELIEAKYHNECNDYENINDQVSDVYISKDNLDFFEIVDKSFSEFLLNLSYEINSELFKINIIKKIISAESFKYLSNNNYIIKHPYPFVIKYDLNINTISSDFKKFSNIYLFNVTNIELEFYNINLSICRNNINELKHKFRSLNKKQRYWKHKEFGLNNLN